MNTRINPNIFLKTLEEEFRAKSKELNLLDEMIKKVKQYFKPHNETAYNNLSVSQAIRKYLEDSTAPQSTKDIADELGSYNLYSRSHDLYNNINATLHRMKDVRKTSEGWVLKKEVTQ